MEKVEKAAPETHGLCVLRTVTRRALEQTFRPKAEVLDELSRDGPFYTLVVGHFLKLPSGAQREAYLRAMADCIRLISARRMCLGHSSSIHAIKAFLAEVDQLLSSKPSTPELATASA